jgi:glycosyltransferase involved in cell wall biosynthesis
MEASWLTAIIPSHNGERWLAATLQSIVDQREKGIETVLVDSSNNSTSLAIADSFSDKLKIRTFPRPDLLSWMAKTNFGVEQASSNRICMLHQDDLWLPNRSAELRRWLQSRPDGVMQLHSCYIIDEGGRRLGLWRCPLPAGDAPVPTKLWYQRLLVQNFVGIPTPTIRRDAYLGVGGLDESLWYTADWDLYLKLASTGDIYYHANPLACFRVHKNSLTVLGSRNGVDFKAQHSIVVDRYSNRVNSEIREETLRLARVSIEVNTALAAAIAGNFAAIGKAIYATLSLGPRGMRQYLFCSRIVDRVIPRLRALVAGTF